MGSAGKPDRSKPLHRMFTAVPPRYDLINTLITWGFDRGWRRKAARQCLAAQPGAVLDLCCGTGDLAIDLARTGQSGISVVGIDYSQPMLELANKKAMSSTGRRQVSFLYGDAVALPFSAGSFDCVGISFARGASAPPIREHKPRQDVEDMRRNGKHPQQTGYNNSLQTPRIGHRPPVSQRPKIHK